MNAIVSVRELNANISAALARVEAGETLTITKNGKAIARLSPPDPAVEAKRRAAIADMMKVLEDGIPGIAPATYEERTGRGR